MCVCVCVEGEGESSAEKYEHVNYPGSLRSYLRHAISLPPQSCHLEVQSQQQSIMSRDQSVLYVVMTVTKLIHGSNFGLSVNDLSILSTLTSDDTAMHL
jgi:hypothetical protein